MLISEYTDAFGKKLDGFQKIKILKDAGFDAFDYTVFPNSIHLNEMSWHIPNLKSITMSELIDMEDNNDKNLINISIAKLIREYADSLNIKCNQTHAPYPSAVLDARGYNEYTQKAIISCLEISSIIGAKICVVHPCNDYTPEQNAEMFNALKPYAIKYGIKIAVENMWNWNAKGNHASPAACSRHDNFLKHMELLDKDVFCACLDIGHAEMFGLDTSAIKMIETLGNRIGALHIHDNDKRFDTHDLPYNGNIDLDNIWKALREVGYSGDVTFECGAALFRRIPQELYVAGAEFLCDIGKYIRNKLQNG